MSYEIAQKYIKKHGALIYPKMPEKPKRETFPNNQVFGAAMDEWEVLRDKCNGARKEYDHQSNVITNEFRDALGAEYGVAKHPKFQRCWEIAWEYGHSSGYNEVAGYFSTLAELLQTENSK